MDDLTEEEAASFLVSKWLIRKILYADYNPYIIIHTLIQTTVCLKRMVKQCHMASTLMYPSYTSFN